MSEEITLIPARASQLDVLKEYIAALYEHDEDYDAMVNIEEGVTSLMRNEALASAFFVREGEKRIGYVILTRYHSVEKGGLTIYIDELYVEPKHRRKGIGSTIMKHIREIAENEGAKTLWVQTEPHNEAAQAFFLAEGFQPNRYKNFERPI